MWQRLRAWLEAVQLNDPIEQQQAFMLQLFYLVSVMSAVIGLPLSLLTINGGLSSILVAVGSYGFTLLLLGISMLLVRRGRFGASVLVYALGLSLIVAAALASTGIRANPATLFVFAVPIVLTGLLSVRRNLALVVGFDVALAIVILAAEAYAPQYVGFANVQSNSTISSLVTFLIVVGVISLFLERFGMSLRTALKLTQAREQELEHLHASLETTVSERTAALEAALQDVEQREARLSETLTALKTSESALQMLSAPVLPVLPGVLVAPLIGELDHNRATFFTDNVLTAIERNTARTLIIDVTGVPTIDSDVAQILLQTAAAVRLLGSHVVLVGVRPEVAQALVVLGISLQELSPYLNLQEAIGALLGTKQHAASTPANRQSGRGRS